MSIHTCHRSTCRKSCSPCVCNPHSDAAYDLCIGADHRHIILASLGASGMLHDPCLCLHDACMQIEDQQRLIREAMQWFRVPPKVQYHSHSAMLSTHRFIPTAGKHTFQANVHAHTSPCPQQSTARAQTHCLFALQVYFKGGCLEVALAELQGKKRAMVITDQVGSCLVGSCLVGAHAWWAQAWRAHAWWAHAWRACY